MNYLYYINYAGNGRLEVLKSPSMFRPSGINVFANYVERHGRIVTEYLPGHGGLNFDKKVFDGLVEGKQNTILIILLIVGAIFLFRSGFEFTSQSVVIPHNTLFFNLPEDGLISYWNMDRDFENSVNLTVSNTGFCGGESQYSMALICSS